MIKQLWKKTCTCLLILGLVLTMAPVMTIKAEELAITDKDEGERVLRETLATIVVDNSGTPNDWRSKIEEKLRKKFVVTGQMLRTNVVFPKRQEATTDAEGSLSFDVYYWLSNPSSSTGHDEWHFDYTIVIPKLLSEGDVIINSDNFPDQKFQEYLGSTLRDKNQDGILSASEINAIDDVNVVRQEISDLTGIGYLKSLKNLSCYGTQIRTLDVSGNPNLENIWCRDNSNLTSLTVNGAGALKYLDCKNTNIVRLDVSGNPNLQILYCQNNSNLKILNVRGASSLDELNCSKTGITSLDVSENQKLTTLECMENAALSSLTVKGANDLTYLDCGDTKIGSLDVSRNNKLQTLYCDNADLSALILGDAKSSLNTIYCDNNEKLTELDVNGSTYLEALECSNTGIHSLDVSNVAKMNLLRFSRCNLAWLNIGKNREFDAYSTKPGNTNISLEVTGQSFDITKAFPGIDPGKVHITGGGTLNGSDVTGYKDGEALTYEYNCGTYLDGSSAKLNVTLTLNILKSDSYIYIDNDLNMDYTGNPVNPEIRVEGSKGKVTATYFKWNGVDWEPYSEIPKDVGTYTITIAVEEDDYFNQATLEATEFEIRKAANEWLEAPALIGWTYGEPANTPTAKAKYGDAVFTYSNTKDGLFTDTMPENAGIWYMKAKVEATANYTGLDTVVKFTITKKEEQKPGDKPNDKPTNKPADKAKAKSSSPVTGDTSNPALLISLLALSGGTLCVCAFRKRKSSN